MRIQVFRVLVLSLLLAGCSATTKVVKHGSLEVETRMSHTIFLDSIENKNKTVFVQVRNTTDKSGVDVELQVQEAFINKGYAIVNNSELADLIVQINILQVGKAASDPYEDLYGLGSAISGASIGFAISGATGGSFENAMAAALILGTVSYVADMAIDVNVYSMTTDVQVKEKIDTENFKTHQTRIISAAKQVNLKFEDAEPELSKGIVQSISGIL